MTHKVPIVKDRLPAIVELFQENGVSIRYEPGKEGDAQVCLTDIWKAKGSVPNKRPTDWFRWSDGSEYLAAFLKESKGVSRTPLGKIPLKIAKQENLVVVVRGKQGGTFAHRLVALEYARHLDKELAVRLNRKLEEAIERERQQAIVALQNQIEILNQQLEESGNLIREKNRQLFLPGFRPSAHPSTRNTIKSIIAESSGPGVSFQRLYRMLLRLTGFDVHAEQERLIAMAPCSRKPTLISIVEGQSHRCFQGRPLSEVALDLAIEMVDGVKRQMRPLQLAASNSNVEVA